MYLMGNPQRVMKNTEAFEFKPATVHKLTFATNVLLLF